MFMDLILFGAPKDTPCERQEWTPRSGYAAPGVTKVKSVSEYLDPRLGAEDNEFGRSR